MAEAYIVAASRTAGGRKGGRLRDWHPSDLAGKVLDDLVARTGGKGLLKRERSASDARSSAASARRAWFLVAAWAAAISADASLAWRPTPCM